jgi:hypothetical protein
MRKIGEGIRTAACLAALMLMALPAFASAADKGHEGMQGMQGMKMEGHGMSGGHDMMKMGDKVFSGKIGPWNGTARVMDMKAHMEASGVKVQGTMPNSHHVAFDLSDAKTNSRVTEGKGTVTVTGPDKKEAKAEFMVMQGHFGADVNLPKPGKYTFKAEIESGGKKGNAAFSYTVK